MLVGGKGVLFLPLTQPPPEMSQTDVVGSVTPPS